MARILLAGADAASLDILSNELMAEGHEVLEASNGQQAYELTLAEMPDMVFLEVNLPVFDGYETCEMIRSDPDVPATLPVIFLVTEDVDKRKLERVGATDTLPTLHQAYEVSEILTAHLSPDAFVDTES